MVDDLAKHGQYLNMLKLSKRENIITLALNAIKGGDNYFFRNLYADDNGVEKDILENGRNSCAAFVSWILLTQELIKTPHATVIGTESDLINSGWYTTDDLKAGAVLFWEKKVGKYDNLLHEHAGFYIGNDEAVSNDSQGTGFPHKHHHAYNGTRKIEKIYWHPALDE